MGEMKTGLLLLVMRALVGLIGTVLILLGLAFWTGHLLSLIRLHMALGGVFVLCLWVLVGCALAMRVQARLAAVVLGWSFIVPLLGIYQMGILPGRWHWVIQALHLVVGGIAIGLGQRLAERLRGTGVMASEAAGSG